MIKTFTQFNENRFSNENVVTRDNFEEVKEKIAIFLVSYPNELLKKGFEFTKANIADYEEDQFVKDLIDSFFDNLNQQINKKNPSFWEFNDKGYTGYKTVGKHYAATKDLRPVEIAKLIRKELAIEFPDYKFSITTRNYKSITVKIEDTPFNPYSSEMDAALKADDSSKVYSIREMYNENYIKDREKMNKIIQQYNMDDSDGQIDYFNTRYYGYVTLDDFKIKEKYYPNNSEVLRIKKIQAEIDAASAKEKEESAMRRGKFKKGTEVIYITEPKNVNFLPEKEYKATVVKSPNGRGISSSYDIRITIDKFIRKGETIILKEPRAYVLGNVAEKYLKQIEENQ